MREDLRFNHEIPILFRLLYLLFLSFFIYLFHLPLSHLVLCIFLCHTEHLQVLPQPAFVP